MKKTSKFCFREAPYPQSAIALLLNQHIEDAGNIFIPYMEVIDDSKKISSTLSKYQTELATKHAITFGDTVIILPLKISRYFPLKPEYWGESDVEYDTVSRMRLFTKLLSNPLFYELLVTPGREKRSWYFKPALPISFGTSDRVIEEFMKRSEWYVDTSAKSCAIYTVGMPWMFNFRTGERHAITKTPQSLPEDVN